MMHTTSPIKKNLLGMVLAGASLAFAGLASAAGLGAGLGVGANINAQVGGQAGGGASTHMSAEGSLNQNSQMRPDASRGMDRAQERMNAMGMEHEMATELEASSKQTVKAKKEKKPSRTE